MDSGPASKVSAANGAAVVSATSMARTQQPPQVCVAGATGTVDGAPALLTYAAPSPCSVTL